MSRRGGVVDDEGVATDHSHVRVLPSIVLLPRSKDKENEVLGVSFASLYSGFVLSYRIGYGAQSRKTFPSGRLGFYSSL